MNATAANPNTDQNLAQEVVRPVTEPAAVNTRSTTRSHGLVHGAGHVNVTRTAGGRLVAGQGHARGHDPGTNRVRVDADGHVREVYQGGMNRLIVWTRSFVTCSHKTRNKSHGAILRYIGH